MVRISRNSQTSRGGSNQPHRVPTPTSAIVCYAHGPGHGSTTFFHEAISLQSLSRHPHLICLWCPKQLPTLTKC